MNAWIAPFAGFCLLLSAFFCSSCSRRSSPGNEGGGKGDGPKPGPTPDKPNPHNAGDVHPYRSRKDLTEALRGLSRSSKPSKLARGAMCYKMSMPRGTVDVTCSACGKKSIHPKIDARHIDACLRLVQSIRMARKPKSWFTAGAGGLNARLDTTEWCTHCNKNGKSRRLHLLVRFRGEKSDHRAPTNVMSLKALLALLKGEDRIRTSNDGELALKDQLSNLQSLLGAAQPR